MYDNIPYSVDTTRERYPLKNRQEKNLMPYMHIKIICVYGICNIMKKHVDEHIFTCYYIYNKNEHKFARGTDIIAFLLYAMYNV